MSNNFAQSDTTFASLNELLDIQAPGSTEEKAADIVVREESKPVIPFREGTEQKEKDQSITDDFNFARDVIHDALEKAQDLVALTIKEAKITGHPIVMQSANQAIKNIAELGKDLLEIHNRIKELKSEQKPDTSKVVVVERSTLDLLKELNQANEAIDAEFTEYHNDDQGTKRISLTK